MNAKRGATNRLTFRKAKAESKPESLELKLDQDFAPLAVGGSGSLDLPLVFVGYGITGKAEHYDDYAGIDVKGKAVVIVRHEPQQDNPRSIFQGSTSSHHAYFGRKIINAQEHGAAAVILCSDECDIQKRVADAHKQLQDSLERLAQEHSRIRSVPKPTLAQTEDHSKKIEALLAQASTLNQRIRAELDPVLPFYAAGRNAPGKPMPVIFCRRAWIDRMVRDAMGRDLASIERTIDVDLKPISGELKDWRVTAEIQVERTEIQLRNVIGVLPGEGPLAEETLLLGAHYDHLGFGGPGARGGAARDIFNGADDNASGVAVLLEIGRQLAARKIAPRRRIVLVAFSGEELGMVGSNFYVAHPLFPLDKTIAMLNFDMVGRMSGDRLVAVGAGTSPRFALLLDAAAHREALRLTQVPGAVGGSDHLPFYTRQIPVLHFVTGMNPDYHRPTDDADKLNIPGMRRVARLGEEVAITLATDPKRPEYAGPNPILRWLLRQLPTERMLDTPQQ